MKSGRAVRDVILLGCTLLLVLGGCGRTTLYLDQPCDDGDEQACRCPDGTTAVRICEQRRWGACQCEDLDGGADADADAPDGSCETHAYQQCAGEGDVYWFDSCGTQEEIAEECQPPSSVCTNLTPTSAWCTCEGEGHWDPATDCTTCLGNWDEATGCTTCSNHWVDQDDDCGTCPDNWDPLTDCSLCDNHWVDQNNSCGTCPPNWDPAADCDACIDHWDPAADCLACLANWDEATDCTTCLGNWNPLNDCTTCKNHWVDQSNNCGTCPPNWDPQADCNACLGNWDPTANCLACLGNWDEATGCTTCSNHWVDQNDDCGTCPGNWDPLADCSACKNHWVDQNNNCGTCPPNWDPVADCNACLGNWDPAQSCLACLPHWDIADDCESCLGHWDPATNCTTCLNYWIDENNDCGTCLVVDPCVPQTPSCMSAMASEAPGYCNQVDDDCDGQVDEGCTCTIGEVQPCFLGPPNFRDQGTCMDGSQQCQAAGSTGFWGDCENGIWPADEQCDDADNNCNGCEDEDQCCDPAIDCSFDPGAAEPFVDFNVNGHDIYLTSNALNWTWELSPGPCGEVLGVPPFTMNGQSTTVISGPNADHLTVNWSLSGDYQLTLTVDTPNGELSCTWLIHVWAPGLRVELCWDTTGQADIDLHLGMIGTTTSWFNSQPNQADCFYENCTDGSWNHPNWGFSDVNGHDNPRLDIDNISTPGVPENINLDNPGEGDQFRVLVHYFSGAALTHPVVNVYCDGSRLATYGVAPQVSSFDDDDTWKVVDVTTSYNGLNELECTLNPILDANGNYWLEGNPPTWP